MDPRIAQASTALESAFYGDGGASGISPLRAALGARRTRDDVRPLLILADATLIDRLLQCGVTGATGAALTLVPVLQVAWADGKIQKDERDAILGGGRECGIVAPECKQLLAFWLDHTPPPAMFAAWGELAAALTATLSSGEVDQLCQEIVELARTVAKAAGGILGIGRISGSEQQALTHIAAAFGR